MREKTFVIQVK